MSDANQPDWFHQGKQQQQQTQPNFLLASQLELKVQVLPEVVPLQQMMSLPAPTSYLMITVQSSRLLSLSDTPSRSPPSSSSSSSLVFLYDVCMMTLVYIIHSNINIIGYFPHMGIAASTSCYRS